MWLQIKNIWMMKLSNSESVFKIKRSRRSFLCARTGWEGMLTPSEAEQNFAEKNKREFWTFQQKVSKIPLQYQPQHAKQTASAFASGSKMFYHASRQLRQDRWLIRWSPGRGKVVNELMHIIYPAVSLFQSVICRETVSKFAPTRMIFLPECWYFRKYSFSRIWSSAIPAVWLILNSKI